MSGADTTVRAPENEAGLADVTPQLLAIGLGAIALGGVFSIGVFPVGALLGDWLGAILVGAGVGVAVYSHVAVQRSAALQALALGGGFVAGALLLSNGAWAAIIFLWGVAALAIGVVAYGFTALSRRSSRR